MCGPYGGAGEGDERRKKGAFSGGQKNSSAVSEIISSSLSLPPPGSQGCLCQERRRLEVEAGEGRTLPHISENKREEGKKTFLFGRIFRERELFYAREDINSPALLSQSLFRMLTAAPPPAAAAPWPTAAAAS